MKEKREHSLTKQDEWSEKVYTYMAKLKRMKYLECFDHLQCDPSKLYGQLDY